MADDEELSRDEMVERFAKAGRIAAEALDFGRALVKPGAKVIDIADQIEAKIVALGGQPAFPVNISFNSTAAHDTAQPNDARVLSGELVKLDVGVHVDGFVGGDTACTIDLSGKYGDLVKASEAALEAALKEVRVGAKLCDIGRAIESTIKSFGFSPVRNLSGHGLGKWAVHGEPTVPNFDNGDETELEDGMVIAIEPFATTGVGLIAEKGIPFIHSLTEFKPVRNPFTRQVMEQLADYGYLPFANRWLTRNFHAMKVNVALKELNQLDMLRSYPPLVEQSGGMVSQAEHSVFVGEKVRVLTRKG